ncbi:MAG: stage II sporulation protein M [Chloroflexi bacterium]|nr:stage II sporulation protein M [Chloroflexota bacterium]MDL1942809.1 stage II sporulation protein M [Chloroflexi bacterium CFX2]
MNVDEFYQSRRREWELLSELLERTQKDVQRLTTSDVERLASLYRAASSDLALAKRDFPRHRITRFLNQLVARTHSVLYQGEPLAWRNLVDFALRGFPRLFRETFIFTLSAFLMFIIPALASGFAVAASPDSAIWLLPAEVQSLIPIVENKELWIDISMEERPYASSFIMQNNIRVSFLAFASGVSGGLFTLWILVQNGLILGGLLGLTSYHDIGFELATFVVGHGVIELSVIFMAGGSGLMLGWALLRPGLMRRRDALAIAARKAVQLLGGAVPWLVLAGIIEGFISPNEAMPWFVKWGVGILSGVLMYSYLFTAGREKQKTWKFE